MSKNKKTGKKHNPNHSRSKNNPADKRNAPRSTGQSTTGAAGPRAALPSGCRRWSTRRARSWTCPRAGAAGVSSPYWRLWASRMSCLTGAWSNTSRSTPMTWSGARCTGRTAGRSTSCVCRGSGLGCSSGLSLGWRKDAVHGTKIADSGGYSIARPSSGRTPSTASSAHMTLPSCTPYTRPRARYAPPWSRRGWPHTALRRTSSLLRRAPLRSASHRVAFHA